MSRLPQVELYFRFDKIPDALHIKCRDQRYVHDHFISFLL